MARLSSLTRLTALQLRAAPASGACALQGAQPLLLDDARLQVVVCVLSAVVCREAGKLRVAPTLPRATPPHTHCPSASTAPPTHRPDRR